MSGDRFAEQYRQLIDDPEARAALVADPKAALVAYFGAIVEGDYRIEVIEQRSDTITAVVPVPPAPGDDVEARRAQVSGRIFDLLHSTGVGGYLIPDSSLTWVLRDMTSRGPRQATTHHIQCRTDLLAFSSVYFVARTRVAATANLNLEQWGFRPRSSLARAIHCGGMPGTAGCTSRPSSSAPTGSQPAFRAQACARSSFRRSRPPSSGRRRSPPTH